MELNRKGSVLIFVLIFIAFAASTVLLIHERSTKSVEEASEDFLANQSGIYAMTALTAVLDVLKEDDTTYDTPRDDWALVPVVEIPYGYISVDIKPINGKISLNNILDSNPSIAERHLNACDNIASELELDSLECGIIKDYIDSDDETSQNGEEGVEYERNGVTFNTKNRPLSTLYELRLLMDNNEQFNIAKDYFTVYSPQKAININFASAKTINAFLPELEPYSDEIVSYASANDYKDPSNIQEATDLPKDIYLEILPFITVKSTLFYVKTEVTLSDVSRYYHAIVKKDGTKTEIVNFLAGINGQYY